MDKPTPHNRLPVSENKPGPSQDGGRRSFPEFEGYRIVEELPRGGQAMVYKAIHEATKTKVALKVLLPGLLISAKARRLFEREVDLVARLNHPNIVRIRDSGVAEGQYFFSMDYIRGHSLDEFVRVNAFSLRQTMVLFEKVCHAIRYAHQKGVIHRDLKPANILVDDRQEPFILDFGLAKSAGASQEEVSMLSMTGEVKGTLNYMSPEQATGRTDDVDMRTDVYSLGVMLYRILAGDFPYDVSGPSLSTLKNIETTDPVRLKKVMSRFDADVESIVFKCLEKDPARRYHSAGDLSEDVGRWLKGEALIARSHNSLYVLSKLCRRHRYGTSVVALLAIIIVSFAFALGQQAKRTEAISQDLDFSNQQMVSQTLAVLEMQPPVLMLKFLEAWQSGDSTTVSQAAALQSRLDGMQGKSSSQEMEAISALLQSVTSETFDAARLRKHPRWFASLIEGEWYLKCNDIERALTAYRLSHQALLADLAAGDKPNAFYRRFIQSRLYELQAKSIKAP